MQRREYKAHSDNAALISMLYFYAFSGNNKSVSAWDTSGAGSVWAGAVMEVN